MVTAKKVGLTLSELNGMTCQDFADFLEMWVGEDPDAPKKATQADIDRLLG